MMTQMMKRLLGLMRMRMRMRMRMLMLMLMLMQMRIKTLNTFLFISYSSYCESLIC